MRPREDQIRAVCEAVSRPVNEIAVHDRSVGGSLTWVAVGALAGAATAVRDRGDFSSFGARLPLDEWLGG